MSTLTTTTTTTRSPLPSVPTKRKTMSITQTYYLAHSARGKLSDEAARSDHRLRRLVGHANLLDSLMLELADAEAEQESWFNASVRGARKTDRHIQWADSVVEEPEEDWQAEDAESDSSDSSDDDEDEEMQSAGFASLQRVKSQMAFEHMDVEEEDEDEEDDIYEDDGEEDYAMLTLSRTTSHPYSPPELSLDLEDDDSSSEDEAMPPSPPSDVLHTFPTSKSPQAKLSPSGQAAFFDESFYLPQRSGPGLVSAISVY